MKAALQFKLPKVIYLVYQRNFSSANHLILQQKIPRLTEQVKRRITKAWNTIMTGIIFSKLP